MDLLIEIMIFLILYAYVVQREDETGSAQRPNTIKGTNCSRNCFIKGVGKMIRLLLC